MVTIKEIQLVGDSIKAKCYQEGMAHREFSLSLNTQTFEPEGDIIINSYVSHAIRKLKELFEEYSLQGKELPKEAKVMWY